MRTKLASIGFCLTISAAIVLTNGAAQAVETATWSGSGSGDSWNTASNWADDLPPTSTHIAAFTNTGSAQLPGEVTNSLTVDWTLAGLKFENNALFHTTDLGANTLTIEGDLNFNTDYNKTSTTTIRNGVLNVVGPLANVNVGRSYFSGAWAQVDLTGLAEFRTTDLAELHVATRTSGNAFGELSLAETNQIEASRIIIGDGGTGILHLGPENMLFADELVVGGSYGHATVDIPNDGTLQLGTVEQPTTLRVGDVVINSNSTYVATLDLSAANIDAHLDHLVVGQKTDLPGSQRAVFIGGDGGSINVGQVGERSDMIVGHRATAELELGGMDSFTANLNQMIIGRGGSATVRLPETVNIDAREIVIAESGSSTLELGLNNTILADEMTVGGSYGNLTATVRSGGTVQLGSADRPMSLKVGEGIINANSTYTAIFDLSAAAVEAHFDHLVVGEKSDNPGGQKAVFIGGDSGSINVGRPGNESDMTIGHRATAEADFSGMDSFTANLNQMIVGRGGSATVRLPETVNIDAKKIVIAEHSSSTFDLGLNNTILADEMIVGGSYGNLTATVRSGGTVQLGSADRPMSLKVGEGIIDANSTYTAIFDLSTAAVEAHFDHLVVGEKSDNPGGQKAVFIGGDSGSINVGRPGNESDMIVGLRATAEADFSGMDSFTANLNQMILGRGGSATVRLPETVNIDAKEIVIAESGNSTLELGLNNTILADEMLVGGSYGTATVTARSGGTVRLGTPDRRANLSVGKAMTNTNSTYTGTLDLTNATVEAWLGHVIVGEKNAMPGGQRGTLAISHRDDNYIDANTIVIGGTNSTGTVDFSGGMLRAGSIERGPGSAYFNWYGGTLSVDKFGSATHSFDLKNTGSGTLAPGDSTGTTTVFGKYTQGLDAAVQIELGGTVGGVRYDQLDVTSTAQLDGTLEVLLYNGFVPAPEDTFDILTASTISGQFANAPAGPGALATPFGTFDVTYSSDRIVLSNFVPDPLAPAASVGFLNDHEGQVLGGTTSTGGVEAVFADTERGILSGKYDSLDEVALEVLLESEVVDFNEPNFVLPGEVMQVWQLEFEGDAVGDDGVDLVFAYDDTGLSDSDEAGLDIYHFDGGEWLPLFGTVDIDANTITVNTPSFSPFAVGVAMIPEPGSISLLLCGLLAGLMRLRRRG